MEAKRKNRRCIVKPGTADRRKLNRLLAGGVESVRIVKRAMVLLKMGDGMSANQAAESVGCTPETARKIGWRYIEGGLDDALHERPRPGNPPLFSAKQKKELIAISCSKPPDGRAHWTTALLAAEVIRRQIVPYVSRETIRVYLQQSDIKPWRKKNVVHPR